MNQAQLPKVVGSKEMETSRNRNLHPKMWGKTTHKNYETDSLSRFCKE